MADVTVHLVELLGLRIDQQRLDLTHIFSLMASFCRTRLMGVAATRKRQARQSTARAARPRKGSDGPYKVEILMQYNDANGDH